MFRGEAPLKLILTPVIRAKTFTIILHYFLTGGDYHNYPNNYMVKSRILSHAHSCGPACKNKYLKMNVYEQDVILTVLGVFARLEQLPISH